MSTKVFDVFEEYSYLSDKRKFTLGGDNKNWTWFKIYVFSKEDVDLVEELDKLNSHLAKHNMHEYGGLLVCLYHLLLPDRAFAFLSKNIKKRIKKWPQLLILLSISREQLMKMEA